MTLHYNRLTARVTRLGWERGVARETEKPQSQENAQKRGAYPKSGARFVGRFLFKKTDSFASFCVQIVT